MTRHLPARRIEEERHGLDQLEEEPEGDHHDDGIDVIQLIEIVGPVIESLLAVGDSALDLEDQAGCLLSGQRIARALDRRQISKIKRL